MATQNWVYRKSDGFLIEGGTYDAKPPLLAPDANGDRLPDFTNYGIFRFPDGSIIINPRIHRIDSNGNLRAATSQESADLESTEKLNSFTTSNKDKEIITTCAQVVRARGIAAWNAMSPQQKKDAVKAELDVRLAIRQFVEDNL